MHALYRLAGWLPLDVASAIGGWVARNLGPRLRLTERARRRLARALPETSPAEIETIMREMWDNLGRTVMELPHLARLPVFGPDGLAASDRIDVVGAENIDRALARGRPILFFAGHLANWELNSLVALRYGVPVHLVYREANNRWIEPLLRRFRAEISGGLIPKGPEGAKLALKRLREGKHLGMLLDQKLNDGIAVPFFGRAAMTAAAPAHLALKFDCVLLPFNVERLGGARFRVTIYPPLEIERSSERHRDIAQIMARVNAIIEGWVRARPGQWLWLHNRWPD